MSRFAYNTSPGPVVVDGHGHTVAGHDWAQVDPTTDEVAHAVELGQLVWRDLEPGPDADPNAVTAWQNPVPSEETAQ